MKTVKFFNSFIFVGILLMLNIHCQKNPTNPFGNESTRYSNDAVALQESTLKEIVSYDSTTGAIIFTKTARQAAEMKIGNILLGTPCANAPFGFLRRVENINTSTNNIIIETSQATLEDAFEELDLEYPDTLNFEDIQNSGKLLKGMSLSKAASGTGINLNFLKVIIYDRDGNNQTTDDQIRADGSITFSPSFDFKIKISWFKLKKLRFVSAIHEEMRLQIDCAANIKKSVTIPITTIKFTPIPIGYIVLVPQLDIFMSAGALVIGGLDFGAVQNATLVAGLEYADKNWNKISDFNASFEPTRIDVNAMASILAEVSPELSIKLYDVAGPTVKLIGYAELLTRIPAQPWWGLYAGIKAGVGVSVKVLGHSFANKYLPILDYREEIARAQDVYHMVTKPTKPTGPNNVMVNQAVQYTTAAKCSKNHDVEYQFVWGDGSVSDWGGSTGTHSYNVIGIRRIKAVARCTQDRDVCSVSSEVSLIRIQGFSMNVTPAILLLDPSANSQSSFNISANTSWNVSDDAGWLMISPTSGSGDQSITVTATEANASTSPRSATVTISGSGVGSKTITVTQNGASAYLNASPINLILEPTANSQSSFDISTNTSWHIHDDAGWLAVSATSGSGDRTIRVMATGSNASASSRSATVTVNGSGVDSITVTVTQNGANAYLIAAPISLLLDPSANSQSSFDISTNTNWHIHDDAGWLSVSATSGSGDRTITVTANGSNTSASSRSATVTILGSGVGSKTISVTQNGASAYLNVNPSRLSVERSANSQSSFNISSNTSWNISDNAGWLTLSTTGGSGDLTITVTATEANTTASSRGALVTISGAGIDSKTVTVTQLGVSLYFNVTPSSLSLDGYEGSQSSFDISSNTSWNISDDAGWLTVSPTSGSGNLTITVTTIEHNPSYTTPRSATVTISGSGAVSKTVIVTQTQYGGM
jgi:hypothetical protein